MRHEIGTDGMHSNEFCKLCYKNAEEIDGWEYCPKGVSMTVVSRIDELESKIKSQTKELERLKKVKSLTPGAYLADHIYAAKNALVIILDDDNGIDISEDTTKSSNKVYIEQIDLAGKNGAKADIADYENFRKLDLAGLLFDARKQENG